MRSALLNHTGSIVQAGESDSGYGHTDADWTPGTVTTEVRGTLQARTERESATGAVISTHVWYMQYADAPASLLLHGAEKTHRLTNVKRDGTVFDAGPFHIVEVQDAAGRFDHLELRLLRAG